MFRRGPTQYNHQVSPVVWIDVLVWEVDLDRLNCQSG